MRPCSPATAALLANPPPGLRSADLFTFTLRDGVTVYRWTSYDRDLLVNGDVYSSRKPWLQRSRWNVANTMQVPTLEVRLLALNDGFSGGADIKAQLTNGLFDGASATFDRVWFLPGTTVINDTIEEIAGRLAIPTTGSGSLDFTHDTRLAGFGSAVMVEMLGGGGDGSNNEVSSGDGSRGGGGGQYAQLIFNPAGAVFNYQIGVHGGSVGTSSAPGTADSWFDSAASTLYAQGGTTPTGTGLVSVPGGSAAAVGTSTVHNGGDGGERGLAAQGAGGGGGAGGPSGGGSIGSGLTGSTIGSDGGNGDNGNAPAGIGTTGNGLPGGSDSAWVGYGPGGGGAGGAGGAPFNTIAANGGNGGGYGAGGGGAGCGVVGTVPGQGTSGILVVSKVSTHAGIRLMGGNVADIEIVGNMATINIKGKVNLLDQYAPRNLYQLGCEHAFCDLGCTLARTSFTSSYTVGSSPTRAFIPWSGSAPANASNYRFGTVTLTSGACAGQQRTVRAADSTGLTLIYPLVGTPAAGDAFTAFEGCDKALSSGSGQDCTARSNTQNWRAFPYVPPADSAF